MIVALATVVAIAVVVAVSLVWDVAEFHFRIRHLHAQVNANKLRAEVMNAGCDAAERGDVDGYHWAVAQLMADRMTP